MNRLLLTVTGTPALFGVAGFWVPSMLTMSAMFAWCLAFIFVTGGLAHDGQPPEDNKPTVVFTARFFLAVHILALAFGERPITAACLTIAFGSFHLMAKAAQMRVAKEAAAALALVLVAATASAQVGPSAAPITPPPPPPRAQHPPARDKTRPPPNRSPP
ncbi:MAG: hypothetical protein AAF170_18250, partial [Bacteroidota bacterium]